MKLSPNLTLAAVLLAGASLAACQRQTGQVSAMPLTMADGPPLADAPPASALPAAAPASVAPLRDPSQGYAYADRAWATSTAFGDSPPDYAFYDDGVTPWVWEAGDNSWLVAEPCDGGERYYYYEPGADEPYFIEDPDYGYGFDGGALVVVYDHFGRQLPARDFAGRAGAAGRFLARGEALRRAARGAPHQAVAANNWDARRGMIAAQRVAWTREATSQPAWRAFHNQHQGQELAHWSGEASRREALAARSDSRLGDTARAAREQRLAQADAHARPAATPLFGGRPALAALPRHGPATTPAGARLAELGANPQQQRFERGQAGAPAPQRAVVARNEPAARMFGPQQRQAPAAERRALFAGPQARSAPAAERRAAAPAAQARAQLFNQRRAAAAQPMRAAPAARFHAAPPAVRAAEAQSAHARQAPAFHAAPSRAAAPAFRAERRAPAFHAAPARMAAPAFHAAPPRMSRPAFHAPPAAHMAAPSQHAAAPVHAAPAHAAPAPHAAPGHPEKH
jgi:hypothetical protein